MNWFALCVLVCCLLWAPGLPRMATRLLRAFGAYLFVSFVVRPAYLLIVQPVPSKGSVLAEPGLLLPTYWRGIEAVAGVAAVGVGALLLAVYLSAAVLRKGWKPSLSAPATLLPLPSVLYGVSWLARVTAVTGVGQGLGTIGVLVSRVLPLGTAVLAVIVIKTDWRSYRSTRQLVATMVVGELLWSVLNASKTPILATALIFYIDPSRPRLSPRVLLLSLASVVTAFGVVQGLKPSSSEVAGQGGLSAGHTLQSLIARFDLLHALSVAHQAGAASYMSLSTALGRSVTGLIPQQLLGVSRVSDGQNWARIMEHSPGGVSLATGPVAEGYAVWGPSGVVLFSLISGAALVVTARCLATTRSVFLGLVAAYLLASTALFEQGLLGLSDTLSSAIQVSLIACALLFLLRAPPQASAVPLPALLVRERASR